MLIDFSVSNFKSFKEKETLSLIAASLPGDLMENVVVSRHHSLLKFLAIYGPNGSGKSNLIEAFFVMRQYALNSARESQAGDFLAFEPYLLSPENIDEPTRLEIRFELDSVKYRYGFKATRYRFVEEWLLETKAKKEYPMFLRLGQEVEVFPRFKEGGRIVDLLRENALFLSLVAQFNGKLAGKILTWFSDMVAIQGLNTKPHLKYTIEALEDRKLKPKVLQMVRGADLGIQKIEIDVYERPESSLDSIGAMLRGFGKKPERKRRVEKSLEIYRKVFSLDQEESGTIAFEMFKESAGTQKYLEMLGLILYSLQKGSLVIVDEFDTRMHPLLTKSLVELFLHPETNPKGAQLVFTTHDTSLMDKDLFRRDQIYFTEKDLYGATRLYSLVEFKPRKETPMATRYLQGRFGGIPMVENFMGSAED